MDKDDRKSRGAEQSAGSREVQRALGPGGAASGLAGDELT